MHIHFDNTKIVFLFICPKTQDVIRDVGHSAPNISHGGRQELDSSAIVDSLLT